MKEITRIHLATTPFNVELDAKRQLENYLAAIEKSLSIDDDTQREIEARMVELLQERGVTSEKVITAADVAAIEEQLGAPGEFIDEQEAEASVKSAATGKRLMRDQERGVIGGVLAGAAAYIGINPLWLRLAAIVLAIVSFGTAILIYVVLWIAMPSAKTAAERLQMAGRPVTLEAIKRQSAEAVTSSEANKALIIIIRVVLGLGFVLGAIASLVTVAAAIMSSWPLQRIDSNGLLSGNNYLLVAFGLAIVSGLLLATLMILAAYASFAWKITKAIVISASVIVLLGLTTFGAAIGLGIYGGNYIQQEIKSMTFTEKVDVSDQLSGVVSLTSKSPSVLVNYHATTGTPRAEVTSINRDGTTPKLQITRQGKQAILSVKNINKNNCLFNGDFCLERVTVDIYGPALTSFKASQGTFNYISDQQEVLDVRVEQDASVSVEESSIDKLTATIARGGRLDISEAAVDQVKTNLSYNASLSVGVVQNLDLITPRSCPSGSHANVEIERAAQLTNNSQLVDQSDYHNLNCTQINIQEPERDFDDRSQKHY